MKKLKFKPRDTFNIDLKKLASLDRTIISEIRSAIDILLEDQELPEEFKDHELKRRMTGYREFHVRDAPSGKAPTDVNDILVIYTIDKDELILIAIRAGSHSRLFPGSNI